MTCELGDDACGFDYARPGFNHTGPLCDQHRFERHVYHLSRIATGMAGRFVYYGEKGGLIKIGSTDRSPARRCLVSGYALLGWEHGGRRQEAKRLSQFWRDRVPGTTEWFHPSAALLNHIASVNPPTMLTAKAKRVVA